MTSHFQKNLFYHACFLRFLILISLLLCGVFLLCLNIFALVIGKIELNFRQFEGLLLDLEVKFEFYTKFRKETKSLQECCHSCSDCFHDLNMFCPEIVLKVKDRLEDRVENHALVITLV